MRPIQVHGHSRPLTQIKYNREGDLLFSSAKDKSPNVWFSHNGERLGTYDGHNGAVMGLDVDYNTQRLLTASADNTVKLWDVQTGKNTFTWEFKTPVRSVEFALGDREALVLTDAVMGNPGLLNIFPVAHSGSQTDVPLQSMVVPGSRATVARWGNLNKTIFTGHQDGTIMSWDPVTGKKLQTIRPHTNAITDMQMSTDKSYFIVSSKDSSAKIIDAATLEEKKCFKSDRPLNSATLSPICEQIIVGGGQEARDVTTTSARAGKFEVIFYHRVYTEEIGRMKAHFSPINTLAFHPTGNSFASGAEEGYVRIYHFDDDYFDFQYE